MTTLPLTDETIAKAERLLTEGKVSMTYPMVGPVAAVQGDSGRWAVVRTSDGRYSCSCPAWAMGKVCSHLVAVSLVTGGWPPEGQATYRPPEEQT